MDESTKTMEIQSYKHMQTDQQTATRFADR
jgi:hypothetical protein